MSDALRKKNNRREWSIATAWKSAGVDTGIHRRAVMLALATGPLCSRGVDVASMVDRPDGDVAASRRRRGNDDHQAKALLPEAGVLCPMRDLVFPGQADRLSILRSGFHLVGLHKGITTGLLRGKRATVAGSILKCWAASARGVWASQSESDTSEKYELLNTSRYTRSVFPVFRM